MGSLFHHRIFIAAFLSILTCVARANGQQDDGESLPTDATKPAIGLKNGYRLQEYDDLALPIDPIVPLSAAVQARNDALSWYMVGRLFDPQHRDETAKALSALRKAVKIDPEAIEIYRSLIPLELAANNVEDAIRYATKAVQLDPGDYEDLQLLARVAARGGRLPEAIKHLEQAIHSPQVEKQSEAYLDLNRLLGQLYLATGQKDLAADCYEILFDAVQNPEKFGLDKKRRNIILKDPLTNYEQIGQVFLDANRLKLALEAFELAGKDSDIGAGNLRFNRAKIQYISGNYEEALAELQKYFDSQRFSKGRQPYELLADILAKLNRSDELIRRLEALAEADAQNVPLHYFFADRLAEAKELDRARTIYNTMLRKSGDPSGYVGLARVLRSMQKADELLDVLVRALSRNKDDAFALLLPEIEVISKDKPLMTALFEEGRTRAQANTLKYEAAHLLAQLAELQRDADTSAEFFRLAMTLNRDPSRQVELELALAKMYFTLQKYRQAIDTYNEVLGAKRLNRDKRAQVYLFLAQALVSDKRTDEALEAIGKAIAINDERPGYHQYQAIIYAQAKRWDDALQKWEQIIRDFPDEKDVVQSAQFQISNIYVQKGEFRKGEEILEKVLEVSPDDAHANNDLGYLWADQGKNLPRAEAMIRKALAKEPDNHAYLDSLGWVLFKMGRVEEAIPPMERATQKAAEIAAQGGMSGGDGTLWDHLGDIQLKAMRIEKAIEAWRTALKHLEEDTSPDTQLIERIKEKLKQHTSDSGPKPAEKGTP